MRERGVAKGRSSDRVASAPARARSLAVAATLNITAWMICSRPCHTRMDRASSQGDHLVPSTGSPFHPSFGNEETGRDDPSRPWPHGLPRTHNATRRAPAHSTHPTLEVNDPFLAV